MLSIWMDALAFKYFYVLSPLQYIHSADIIHRVSDGLTECVSVCKEKQSSAG